MKLGWLPLLLIAATACSVLNRDGPDVTCADLGGGSKNACASGIIATCSAGKVHWQVCDDKSACEQSWQQSGDYRCNESDELPVLTPSSGGSANSGGDAGATDACGWSWSSSTCASCVEQSCCASSQACAQDAHCSDCATRTGNEAPCAPDLSPTYKAYVDCLSQNCGSGC
jgi:hypothetical protein